MLRFFKFILLVIVVTIAGAVASLDLEAKVLRGSAPSDAQPEAAEALDVSFAAANVVVKQKKGKIAVKVKKPKTARPTVSPTTVSPTTESPTVPPTDSPTESPTTESPTTAPSEVFNCNHWTVDAPGGGSLDFALCYRNGISFGVYAVTAGGSLLSDTNLIAPDNANLPCLDYGGGSVIFNNFYPATTAWTYNDVNYFIRSGVVGGYDCYYCSASISRVISSTPFDNGSVTLALANV